MINLLETICVDCASLPYEQYLIAQMQTMSEEDWNFI